MGYSEILITDSHIN